MSYYKALLDNSGSSDIYLRHSDPTLFGQLLFGLLTGIRIGQVGVEVLVQHLCCLLVEVTPLTSDKRKKDKMQMTDTLNNKGFSMSLIPIFNFKMYLFICLFVYLFIFV